MTANRPHSPGKRALLCRPKSRDRLYLQPELLPLWLLLLLDDVTVRMFASSPISLPTEHLQEV